MARWRTLPLLALLALAGWHCNRQAAAPETLEVAITGADYQWDIRYPGDDGRTGTGDDFQVRQNLYLPQNRHIRLVLTSRDYLYTFRLPDFGLKEIAVPDLTFTLEFDTGAAGTYALRGDQFCGDAHPSLLGQLVVLPPGRFARWAEKTGNQR